MEHHRAPAEYREVKPVLEPSDDILLRGRACYERREWNDAFEALSLADRSMALDVEDLHRLAWSAGLSAHDEAMMVAQERVYHARLTAGEQLLAARAAFWLGFRLLARGEPARASGWLSRAQRLVDQHAADCVERGYLLLPAAQRHLSAGELAEAQDCARRALEIGERFREPDLCAFGRNLLGRGLLSQGQVERGLAQLDEAMVAATSGELTPVVTGIIYCSAIASCHRVFALERVREWTAALSSWCDAHPQLGLFNGHCLVHRAEVLEMNGAWPEAVDEARRAVVRCVRSVERDAAGRAHYQQAEIHRLRGAFEHAEAAYLESSRAGFEPQPGLALLRLAQGEHGAAASAIQRVVDATRDRLPRIRFLPGYVEIMLAAGDIEAALAASRELDEAANSLGTDVLVAIAAHARGSVELAQGNPRAALDPARRAFDIWQRMGAPYLAARLRVLLARACSALGDVEGAQLELRCAHEVFEKLGALPDLAQLEALGKTRAAPDSGLTERELQVLRLLATGMTNKAIARELSLSEKTVDRHVSNIFGKVGVATRAAATACAYERKLI
jgi:ATP/maltotriose-dependent transcriptional regulator MalT